MAEHGALYGSDSRTAAPAYDGMGKAFSELRLTCDGFFVQTYYGPSQLTIEDSNFEAGGRTPPRENEKKRVEFKP